MTKKENELTVKDLEIGAIITEPGNSDLYLTGDWKSERPVFDYDLCNNCGLCFLYCPEGCIQLDEDECYQVDLSYCKGCGICAHDCPRDAIAMVEEEE